MKLCEVREHGRINHGGHGVPRSFDTKTLFSSVKLRVLRGKKFFLDSSGALRVVFSIKSKLLFNVLLCLQKNYKYDITVRDDEEYLWRK